MAPKQVQTLELAKALFVTWTSTPSDHRFLISSPLEGDLSVSLGEVALAHPDRNRRHLD